MGRRSRPAPHVCGQQGMCGSQAHLAQQIGRTHHVLMENPHMGRTEQFTEVTFVAPQSEGQIVSATITGAQGTQLTARI